MTEANKNPEEVQSEQPSVTVNDLVNIYNIIDLASKRGAFQAAELSSVGAIANKVKAFVDHVQAQQKAAADAAGEAAGEQPAETTDEGSAS